MTLEEKRQRRKELADAMNAIMEAAKDADSLTDEQASQFDEHDAEFQKLDAEIKEEEKVADRRQRLEARKQALSEPRPSVGAAQTASARGDGPVRAPGEPAKTEFEKDDHGNYTARGRQQAWESYFQHLASKGAKTDPRLADLWGEGEEASGFALPGLRAEQSVDTGGKGGYAVPTQFDPTLRQVAPQSVIVRPRATVIPAGDPPDAQLSLPALDQSADVANGSMYGGVVMKWIGEGDTKPETDLNIRPVTLEPHEVSGHIVTSDKLLRNWQAAAALIPRQLRNALAAEEDTRFTKGDGVAKPKGFVNADSAVTQTRDTANDIKYADLVGMETLLHDSAMGVWVTSPRNTDKLRQLQTPEGQFIWGSGDANQGLPPQLLGRPVLYSTRMPALGSKGDIALVDLSFYLIKDGSGPFVASSEHVKFTENKTVIKIFSNVDGQSWLHKAIREEDGNDYSPFVLLAA